MNILSYFIIAYTDYYTGIISKLQYLNEMDCYCKELCIELLRYDYTFAAPTTVWKHVEICFWLKSYNL